MFKFFLLLILYFYKFGISTLLGKNCRFYPSCSDYAIKVISRYGVWKGSLLTSKRLCKCHSWHFSKLNYITVFIFFLLIIVNEYNYPD